MPALALSIASPTVPLQAGPDAGQETASAAAPSVPSASAEPPAAAAEAAPLGRTARPVTPSITVTGGAVSTRNVHTAGDGSTLSAASIARAWKRCSPSASASVVHGDVHGVQAPSSSRHSKREPGSPARSAKPARLTLVTCFGPDAITVLGATVSTVNVRVAGVSSAPNASTARTSS